MTDPDNLCRRTRRDLGSRVHPLHQWEVEAEMRLEEAEGWMEREMETVVEVEVDVKMERDMPMPWWSFCGLECVQAASGLSFHVRQRLPIWIQRIAKSEHRRGTGSRMVTYVSDSSHLVSEVS
jgi:hypothetical protein